MVSKRAIHLVQLESIETRYTKQWRYHLPDLMSNNGFYVFEYYGAELDPVASPGAFLNWSSTNYFKSSQGMKIAKAFDNGRVHPGDVFLFTDFWNPVVIMVKYMSVMMNIPVKIIGLAHAGSYDEWDWLGRQTRNNDHWVKTTEGAMTSCYDAVVFATHFHREMFQVIANEYGGITDEVIAGFPMEYIKGIAKPSYEKQNMVLFTQRNAPEKQPWLFDKLARDLKDTGITFVNVQDLKCSKEQYHEFLNSAKLVVSFAQQETLGITPYEALVCGCDILVPNRLSYREMYSPDFRYNHDEEVAELVLEKLQYFDSSREKIQAEADRVGSIFFSSEKLINLLKSI